MFTDNHIYVVNWASELWKTEQGQEKEELRTQRQRYYAKIKENRLILLSHVPLIKYSVEIEYEWKN
jgi:hypothetical protein